MAKNESNKTRISLEFELPQQDYDTLTSAAPDGIMPFLRAQSEAYFREIANGALVLTGAEVARISKSAKTPITSSDEVVEIAEKILKNVRGQKTLTINIDPTIIASLQQNADFLGISVDEYIQELWNHVHANGWLATFMPDVFWLPFDLKEIKKLLKAENPTSKDVVDQLKKAAA